MGAKRGDSSQYSDLVNYETQSHEDVMQFVTERVRKKADKKETPAKEPQTIDLNPISEES